MTKTLCAAAAALLIATPALADDPLLVQLPHLSLSAALKVAEGAMAACRDKGFEVAVTVVDRAGTVQVTPARHPGRPADGQSQRTEGQDRGQLQRRYLRHAGAGQ
ncbi:hypothetical protein [uncultured Thiodictyon sp.]|uniref:hypothetical protein n=1 Tax=uncultured Thiodictyon sp. TaxID=1846217 RepID=UPI0026011D32|nr:hypothetical protein [uncultured Thiodictyon sp.]